MKPLVDGGQRQKLTRDWGERWARLLWEEFLGRLEIDWIGKTVLDFGCAAGYLPVHLVEQAGVAEAHGVDLHPMWEMVDGFRADAVPGVQLHAGDVLEIPKLQGVHFDLIVSIGTAFLLEPSLLMRVLNWFFDHLKPGGRCLIATRTFAHYDGADLGLNAPRFSHLLFGQDEIREYLESTGAPPARYVNPSCAATYLVQFVRAGFVIDSVRRLRDGIDEGFLSEHRAKLHWIDPQELHTSGLELILRRPLMPDLSIVDQHAARD